MPMVTNLLLVVDVTIVVVKIQFIRLWWWRIISSTTSPSNRLPFRPMSLWSLMIKWDCNSAMWRQFDRIVNVFWRMCSFVQTQIHSRACDYLVNKPSSQKRMTRPPFFLRSSYKNSGDFVYIKVSIQFGENNFAPLSILGIRWYFLGLFDLIFCFWVGVL